MGSWATGHVLPGRSQGSLRDGKAQPWALRTTVEKQNLTGGREEAGGPGWELGVREPGKAALGQAPRGLTVRVGHSWALLCSQDQRWRRHLARDRDTESAPFALASNSLTRPTKSTSVPSGPDIQQADKAGRPGQGPQGSQSPVLGG